MTNDEIALGIETICAPLPECRELRDRILDAVTLRNRGLESIIALPSEQDLLTNALARAMYEYALRGLEKEPW